MRQKREDVRNVAIIAHVDHGKTTLVDELLKQSGVFRENQEVAERVMDSNDIERERGITILSKNTAVMYKGTKINIIDTPGHADFGGEVERVLKMVNGVILVVDAFEGAMPQTKFVLRKALELKLPVIVCINKIDRPEARPDEVVDEVLELFLELDADDSQLDCPFVYASAKAGIASLDADEMGTDMEPLFETILNYIPAPEGDPDAATQVLISTIDYNDYVGRIGIGRIQRGKIHVNESVTCVRADGSHTQFRIQKLYGFIGLHRIEIEEASAGDIVAIAGLADIGVGETVCTTGQEEALPLLHVDEPTIQMVFGTNTSPFAGQDGKFVTARQIEERLFKETNRDVSLKIERIQNKEEWIVSGRGELHLSILIENMRREGYELQVSKPKAIMKEIDGVLCEPYEEVTIEAPDDCIGAVIESLGYRRGVLETMDSRDGQTRVVYTIPSRGLFGFMTNFLTMTKGYGIISHSFIDYRPMEGETVGKRNLGVLISIDSGQTTAYSLGSVEDRGVMFVGPGVDVYEGMIVGEHSRDNDLTVNVTKGKQMTNTRSSSKDSTVVLKRPRQFNLESCLDYINEDELVEVTPENIRLRKRYLTENERRQQYRKNNA